MLAFAQLRFTKSKKKLRLLAFTVPSNRKNAEGGGPLRPPMGDRVTVQIYIAKLVSSNLNLFSQGINKKVH